MEVDHSDILGGPILQNSRENQSSWFSASNVILTVLGLLGLYIAGVQVWTRVLIWKEKSYKLAMRRRHGIPDNDHRPFNVAYAAVVLARQEQEAAARRAMLARPPVPQPTEPEQGVRQRQGTRREESSAALMSVPGRFEFPSDSGYSTGSSRAKGSSAKPFADRLNFEDRYNPNPGSRNNGSVYAQSSAARSRKASHKSLIKGDSRKRAFTADEDADLNDVKKSKYEHEEDALEEIAVPRRGYKRVASEDDEEDVEAYEAKRGREKRLRKISLEKSPQYDSEMDIYEEEEDHVPEMKSIVRGKKRDRAEAGSTFGGDEEDSDHEVEVDDQKSHRHRKRRNRRKSEGIPSRGKKRDRDVEEESSDLDSDEAQVKAARKKRGKKASPKVEADDVSMDESPAPSVGSGRVKRRIGEEWESNGVKFKIGPNGQRLRLTLVKKERQKFPMPMDSQHPDRQANLEVCIETWLTEQEYREAKENYRLAWQDASKSPSEPATPAATEAAPPSPKKGGKDLLWSSTASGLPTPQVSPPSTPAKANGFRQSILGGTPLTPFAQGQVSSKRIASAPRTSFSGYGSSYGSPSLNGKPQLTKWEKEEMEANAIMRLRRKKDEEKKKQEEEAKAAKEKAEQEKKVKEAAAAAAVPKAPAITITPPAEVKQADAKPAISLFGAPPTASQPATSQLPKAPLFGTAPQTDTKAPGSAAPAAPPAKPAGSLFDFAKPADSAPKPPPSLNFGAPAATSTAPSTGSSLKFSFSNPAATTAAPNAEEKKDIVSAPSSANPLFSRLGPQPSSTSQASSAAASTTPVFSFTNSAASEPPKQSASLFSAPAATVPAPAAPAATSNAAPKFSFGLDKTTAPAPASFGSTFGAPKATAPAPTSSSSLSGALGSETKPASTPSPSFSFQKPTSAGTTSTGSAFGTPAASGTSAPTFNFSGGSLFGGNKTDQKAPEADKPAAAAPSTPAKAPFSFPSSTGSNAASTAPATSSGLKFSFGAPAPASTGTSTDAPKSAFGGGFGASTTPATSSNEAPKPALGFGTTTTATPAPSGFNFGTPSTSSEAPKPFGSFGGSSTPAATTSNDAPKTGFASFGSSATNGTTTNGEASKPPLFGGFSSNTSSSSPFGSGNAFGSAKTGEAAKTPAAFGFGTPVSSATNGVADGAQKPALTLAFGAPAASTNGSGSAFNFGNGDAAKATTQPSGGSIFGGSSTANGSASPFGNFGAAGGFSFSKTPSTAGDK